MPRIPGVVQIVKPVAIGEQLVGLTRQQVVGHQIFEGHPVPRVPFEQALQKRFRVARVTQRIALDRHLAMRGERRTGERRIGVKLLKHLMRPAAMQEAASQQGKKPPGGLRFPFDHVDLHQTLEDLRPIAALLQCLVGHLFGFVDAPRSKKISLHCRGVRREVVSISTWISVSEGVEQTCG